MRTDSAVSTAASRAAALTLRQSFEAHPATALLVAQGEPPPQALLAQMLTAPLELLERDAALLATAAGAGEALAPIGIAPLFVGQRTYRGENTDWVFLNLADDPLASHPGGLPLPRMVLSRLRRLRRAGVTFSALYMAHEIPRGLLAAGQRASLDQLAPAPSAVAQRIAGRLGAASGWAWRAMATPLMATAQLARVMLRALDGSDSAIAAPDLDPILVGATVAPGRAAQPGELACWHSIAHWAYDSEAAATS